MPDKPASMRKPAAAPPPVVASAIRGLDAVVLIARDFDAQVAFYRDTLGLQLEWASHDAAFFRIGAQKLAIFAKSHHPQAAMRLGGGNHGLSHLEFALDAADHAAVAHRLDTAGARAYGENFEDADGNLFHFNVG